jgi:hypothetical protein
MVTRINASNDFVERAAQGAADAVRQALDSSGLESAGTRILHPPCWPPYPPYPYPAPPWFETAIQPTRGPEPAADTSVSPPVSSTGADDKRLAVVLSELKAARPKVDSKDPKVVQDGWKHIALQVGYLIGLLEARGATLSVNASSKEPPNTRAAVDELIRALENALGTPTRMAQVLFLAGIALGLLICRGCS